MLTMEPGACSRQELAKAMWPEGSAKSARSNLRATVMRIRKAIPFEVLETTADSVRLRPGAVHVESISARDDFMPGYYGEWVEQMRRTLTEEDPQPEPAARPHPLISATEWLLAQNPQEALVFMTQMEHHLLTLPPGQALALYSQVLEAVPA